MSAKIPEYSAVSLQIALDSETCLPRGITEFDFHHQIQTNTNIRWDVNPFILEEDLIRIVLDPGDYNRWKSMQYICSAIVTFIAYWGLRTWTYEMLLILLVIPFAIVALPHAFFIFCMGIFISVKLYFDLTIPLFWIIILLVGISYTITKTSDDRARRAIIQKALNNWETFWKYYSLQIIYLDWTFNSDQLDDLVRRYPELILSENYPGETGNSY